MTDKKEALLDTLTTCELIALLSKYPKGTRVELTVLKSDLDKCDPVEFGVGPENSGINDALYPFGFPGDHCYAKNENTVALAIWSEELSEKKRSKVAEPALTRMLSSLKGGDDK